MNTYELSKLDNSILRSNEVLTESHAYNIAYPKFGFIIVRHVNSKQTDYYWKECYTCICLWYT